MRRAITAIMGGMLLLSLVVTGPAKAVPVQAVCSWLAPNTGSPVHHYQVQLKVDAGAFANYVTTTTTSALITLESGHTYIVRVAGVDAQSRQGVWSAESDPYTPDLGAPGACGKPIVVQN